MEPRRGRAGTCIMQGDEPGSAAPSQRLAVEAPSASRGNVIPLPRDVNHLERLASDSGRQEELLKLRHEEESIPWGARCCQDFMSQAHHIQRPQTRPVEFPAIMKDERNALFTTNANDAHASTRSFQWKTIALHIFLFFWETVRAVTWPWATWINPSPSPLTQGRSGASDADCPGGWVAPGMS